MALRMEFERGRPESHHPDPGVEYAATACVGLLNKRGVKPGTVSAGEPEENR